MAKRIALCIFLIWFLVMGCVAQRATITSMPTVTPTTEAAVTQQTTPRFPIVLCGEADAAAKKNQTSSGKENTQVYSPEDEPSIIYRMPFFGRTSIYSAAIATGITFNGELCVKGQALEPGDLIIVRDPNQKGWAIGKIIGFDRNTVTFFEFDEPQAIQ